MDGLPLGVKRAPDRKVINMDKYQVLYFISFLSPKAKDLWMKNQYRKKFQLGDWTKTPYVWTESSTTLCLREDYERPSSITHFGKKIKRTLKNYNAKMNLSVVKTVQHSEFQTKLYKKRIGIK